MEFLSGQKCFGTLRGARCPECSHPTTPLPLSEEQINRLAEKMLDSYWNADEVKNDYERAAVLLGGAHPKPIFERCRRRVYSLWPEIARLAEALLERKVMNEAEIAHGARVPPLSRL